MAQNKQQAMAWTNDDLSSLLHKYLTSPWLIDPWEIWMQF